MKCPYCRGTCWEYHTVDVADVIETVSKRCHACGYEEELLEEELAEE